MKLIIACNKAKINKYCGSIELSSITKSSSNSKVSFIGWKSNAKVTVFLFISGFGVLIFVIREISDFVKVLLLVVILLLFINIKSFFGLLYLGDKLFFIFLNRISKDKPSDIACSLSLFSSSI